MVKIRGSKYSFYFAGKLIAFAGVILMVSLMISSCSARLDAGKKPMDTPETPEVSIPAVVPEGEPEVIVVQEVSSPAMLPSAEAVPKRLKTDTRLGFSLTNFTEDNFIGSGRCAMCHSDLVDSQGNDVSIANHWRSTMMANAAKDPLWQAKVDSEVARNPALKDVIEKKCVSCHMPIAYRQLLANEEKYKKEGPSGLFDTFLNYTSTLHEAAMDGVSCSLCHQIQDKGLGAKETFSGNFMIDTKTPPPDREIFGPYKEVVTYIMQDAEGFTPVYGPQTNDSALCASCHMLYTPFVDARGQVVGEFPEQTIYLEWLNSIYGEKPGERHEIGEIKGTVRICQECHMPHSPGEGFLIAKPSDPDVVPKDHFSQHYFVGGNIFMLNILQDNMIRQNISASTQKLEDTKKRTRQLLQEETAVISIVKAEQVGNSLTAVVQVQSKVGHKFPSGIPIRQAWIHFTVADAAGKVIFESGRPMAKGGISGNDGDEKTRSYEPHYDRIVGPDQVQIYEAVMQDTDNNVTFTLLRAARYIKDNRLLPRGFDKGKASPDIAVYGNAADDRNFSGGFDQVTYVVDVGNIQGPLEVRAELLYATVSKAFVNDLRNDRDLKKVARFVRYFERADKTPVMVALDQQKVR